MGTGFGNIHCGIMGRKAHGDFTGLYGRAAGAFVRPHGKVQIDGCGAVFGAVGQVGDQPVGGILLGALEHMGDACGGNHPVFQQDIANLNGGKQKLITIGHSGTS